MARVWLEPFINLVICFVCLYSVLIFLVFLFQRGNRWALLSYCELLLDATAVGTNHIDTCYTDVGADGLARLDGEVGDGQATGIDDADVGSMVQGRRDVEAMRMNGEEQVALTEVVARRVFIVTEGERRVVAVEEDRLNS